RRYGAARKDEHGHHEPGQREAADAREQVRTRAAREPLAVHAAALRRRAAKAPSVPWRCGSTRRRPASSTVSGTVPAAGGSSLKASCSARKLSSCASFSSGSSEQVE